MIPGDGVGPEIMDSVEEVLNSIGAPIDFEVFCDPWSAAETFEFFEPLVTAEHDVRFDPDAARTCIAEVRRAADECTEPGVWGACADVFAGMLPEGAPCDSTPQCASDLYCDGADSSDRCAGVCRARARAGEPCTGARSSCADGLTCSDSDVCEPLAAAGESCATSDCERDLHCDSNALECYESGDADGRGCMEDWHCPTTHRCLSGLCGRVTVEPRAGVGEACDGAMRCSAYLKCVDGVCAPHPGPGEPCSDIRRCALDLTCTDGRCANRQNGEPCDTDGECRSSRCASGTCQPRLADGERCTSSSECRDGSMCSLGACAPVVACE